MVLLVLEVPLARAGQQLQRRHAGSLRCARQQSCLCRYAVTARVAGGLLEVYAPQSRAMKQDFMCRKQPVYRCQSVVLC